MGSVETSCIVLEEPGHHYRLPDGSEIPSVTRILNFVPPWSEMYRHVDLATLEYKRQIGIAAHRATELHDDGDLDMATVDPEVLGYLQAWIAFKWQTGFEPEARELRVQHPTYGYVGRLDAIGRVNGARALVDIKCTAALPEHAGPQTAAYREALRAEHPTDTEWIDRWCVQLRADATYRLLKHTNRRDFAVFLAALELYNFSHPKGC